jgi:hypothetical protein
MPEPNDYVIVFFVVLVLIVFLGWMIYLILISESFSNTKSGQNADSLSQVCPVGSCATNIYTGQKRCPNLNSTVAANVTDEVCNLAFGCNNVITPYAVQSDGSAIYTGTCEPNIECPCLSYPRCASYITSLFVNTNGNPYQSTVGQQILFQQVNTYEVPSVPGISVSDTPPIIIDGNPASSFCTIPINWLPISTPGCNFTDDILIEDNLLACMGLPNDCNGVTANPCLYGTLAFIPNNPNTIITSTNFSTIPVACVRGTPCPCGQVAVWNNNVGQIICTTLT